MIAAVQTLEDFENMFVLQVEQPPVGSLATNFLSSVICLSPPELKD